MELIAGFKKRGTMEIALGIGVKKSGLGLCQYLETISRPFLVQMLNPIAPLLSKSEHHCCAHCNSGH